MFVFARYVNGHFVFWSHNAWASSLVLSENKLGEHGPRQRNKREREHKKSGEMGTRNGTQKEREADFGDRKHDLIIETARQEIF